MKPRFLTLTCIVIAAALFRLIPHPWNLTPVAAIALFGAAQFSKKSTAILLPLAAMFLSDLVLGLHATLPFVYIAFLLTSSIGLLLRDNKRPLPVLAGAVGGSLVFFFLTNFGHWLVTDMYPNTAAGLAQCFTLALPFLRNTLIGDILFTGLLFGGFHAAEKFLPALRETTPAVPQKTLT